MFVCWRFFVIPTLYLDASSYRVWCVGCAFMNARLNWASWMAPAYSSAVLVGVQFGFWDRPHRLTLVVHGFAAMM